MAREEPDVEALNEAISSALVSNDEVKDGGGVQITCFSELVNDVALHFQILRLPKQVSIHHSLLLFSFSFSFFGSIIVSFFLGAFDFTNLINLSLFLFVSPFR